MIGFSFPGKGEFCLQVDYIFQKQGTISDGRYTPHHSARVGTSRQTAGKQCHPRQPRTTSPPRGTFAHEHSTQHRQQRCGALPFSGAAVHCAGPGWRAYSHGAGMHVGGRCTYRRQQGRSAEPMGASPAQSLVSEVSISESARVGVQLSHHGSHASALRAEIFVGLNARLWTVRLEESIAFLQAFCRWVRHAIYACRTLVAQMVEFSDSLRALTTQPYITVPLIPPMFDLAQLSN